MRGTDARIDFEEAMRDIVNMQIDAMKLAVRPPYFWKVRSLNEPQASADSESRPAASGTHEEDL